MSIEETQIEIKSTQTVASTDVTDLGSPLSVGIFRLSSNAPMLDAAAEFLLGLASKRGWYGS